ncbi:MAG TPA: cytochrome c biogenesis CcdA family protein [Acidimicrobiales bacterium]|nr:cytochrome c biogenesis CcdA family protein [Acidimicrobiales bacterium]
MIAGVGPDAAPFAWYLGLGMVAVVNPCGFAMLPAYLAYFLGVDGDAASRGVSGGDRAAAQASFGAALRVAAAVSAGFLAVFALAGFAVELTSLPVYEHVPWISIVIGAGLFALGVAMLAGFELDVRLPRLDRGGRERTVGSMFVFGVSYAIASIGCTLPLFLAVISGVFNRESAADGILTFGIYGLGMALVLGGLTAAIAMARTSIVRFLRRVQPYIGRVAGGLVALAGAYVAYYGWLELRVARATGGTIPSSGITDVVTGWSYDVSDWIERIGSVTIALGVGAALGAVALAVYGTRRQGARRSMRQPEDRVMSRR